MNENMLIWDKVERTDPSRAKKFNTGKHSGTSPNATWNFKRATEIFGPAGEGWKIDVVGDRLERLTAPDGEHVTHVMVVDLHWALDGKSGVVRGYGQTPVVYGRGDKWTVDHDYAKKSYTDAATNALKQLGFSADIWLGLYDDNRYVAEMRREFGGDVGGDQPKQAPKSNGNSGYDKYAKPANGDASKRAEAAIHKAYEDGNVGKLEKIEAGIDASPEIPAKLKPFLKSLATEKRNVLIGNA